MSTAKVAFLFNRGFSKAGLPLLRLSQGESEVSVRRSETWMMKSVVMLSLFGLSFSVFSTRQLREDCSHKHMPFSKS